MVFFFFFSSRRRHTRSKRDWSSDVCSSDLQKPLHGCGFLQVCGNLRQNSFLCIGGFERQNAFQRFAHAWLANAKGNARMSLHFFPAQREAQLIKEKLVENQAAVCRRAK